MTDTSHGPNRPQEPGERATEQHDLVLNTRTGEALRVTACITIALTRDEARDLREAARVYTDVVGGSDELEAADAKLREALGEDDV